MIAEFLAGIVPQPVEQQIDHQQQSVDEQPFPPKQQRPQEWHALQISQKQRRIADRQQAAAAIADDENEEHDRVGDVLALSIGFQQRPNQQHRGAGRADEAGQHAADGHERGVRQRMGLQVARDANAAADRVQAEQQHDERNELLQDGVFQNGPHEVELHRTGRWLDVVMRRPMPFDCRSVEKRVVGQDDCRQRQRHEEPIQIRFPPVRRRRYQRQHGDSGEQQDERNHRPQRRGDRRSGDCGVGVARSSVAA